MVFGSRQRSSTRQDSHVMKINENVEGEQKMEDRDDDDFPPSRSTPRKKQSMQTGSAMAALENRVRRRATHGSMFNTIKVDSKQKLLEEFEGASQNENTAIVVGGN